MKWLPLATVAVAAGAVAAMAGSLLVDPGSPSGAPPLAEPPDAGSMGFGVPADVGRPVSISGPFVVDNTGDRSIALDGAELVGQQSGLVLRGAYVVPYPDHPQGPRPPSATIGVVYGYRLSPSDQVFDGATVAPHAQIAIVFGVKATKPGRHTWSAVEVRYHDGRHSYLSRYPLSGRICAPAARYARTNGCPTPLDSR